ncbi:Putative phosphatase [Corynebacterium ciconiae DSM 44920]|uniref:Cof-type HAD-IIB family hydrolase n=1 Tax=Corynebacterium ciconiae TaxID=227319 RepID=UPI000365D4FB|nr:Cof-type HAD-IIB family hydrolase [Corynebacterium ciconiae]WKD60231.1 Putative phosphatase [Corynebacterium ciconiae DSM 44920]
MTSSPSPTGGADTRPLLIATDVDGTLIDDAERIPPRVVSVLQQAVREGTKVVLATGRPPRWIFPILEQLGINPLCVCANGAIVYDSAQDSIIHSAALKPDTLRTVARIATEVLDPVGGVHFAVERAGRSAFDPTHELFAVAPDYSHAWESQEYGVEEHKQLFASSAVKLLVRSEHLSSEKIAELLRAQVPTEMAHVTFSMSGGLVEVCAPGVNKAVSLAQVANYYGIDAADVMSFGDMPNDCEMLRWSGRSYAMGNAAEEVQAAANATIGDNNAGAIADVLEPLFFA